MIDNKQLLLRHDTTVTCPGCAEEFSLERGTKESQLEARAGELAKAKAAELINLERASFERQLNEKAGQLPTLRAEQVTLLEERGKIRDERAALALEVQKRVSARHHRGGAQGPARWRCTATRRHPDRPDRGHHPLRNQTRAKLKEDMRECRTAVGILVTMPGALPKEWPGKAYFALHEDIWVTQTPCTVSVAEVLRVGIMESEKNTTMQRWARREKQLQSGQAQLLSIGGEVQGLAQQDMPLLELETDAGKYE